ncbi:unnamed protein product [Diatraea saccharalis]|uniref:Uncharacterized protein n=1 Tax=Diatraea saccharalis TaxID=40085 RepID=A0A9N9WKV9_9NEOP|nr:unnamed protein product [Diatraea saccharalis]
MCKRRRYNEIKNDPELLDIEKEKRRHQYLKRKKEKKVVQLKDKTLRSQREQRRRRKENSRKYRERKQANLNLIILDDTFPKEGPSVLKEEDPLQHATCPAVQRAIRKIRYKELKKRKLLISIIDALKKENASQCKKIHSLQKKLDDTKIKT